MIPRQRQVAFFQNNGDPECLEVEYVDAGTPGDGEGLKRFEEAILHSRRDPQTFD